MRLSSRILTAAAVALAIGLPARAHDGVHIHDPYARLSPQSGAVFFRVESHLVEDDRLIAARTDVAKVAELHTHVESGDGVMQMRKVEGGIVIPALSTHALARGGDHVMLMGLTRKLAQGDSFELTLVFETAGEMVIEVPVDNDRAEAAPMDHSAHSADH